ncbi:WXG100 family type VII secretion target [Ornithinimicrobium sp. W1665]|uniref:WXG100 family type VII secretion target n=1 Tax=Ornithinimicrobium sp. W1665 TaxID=3416666 RepID=UPI003D6C5F88
MVDRIGVDVGAVEALAGRLDRAAGALQEVLLRLVGPGWERAGAAVGDAALRSAVTEAGQEWTRYAVALGTALDALARATRESARAYAETEGRVATGWDVLGAGASR